MPIGSIIGGITGAIGAGQQASAEKYAAQLQYQAEQTALAQQQSQFAQNQQNISPFVQAGQGATTSLANLMSVPGQGLLTPWTQQFEAPTLAQAEQQPGYQFTLQEGLKAMQNSAAARGGLLSGATQKALQGYGQQAATTNYQNVYNNLLNQYQMGYQQFQQNQANTYNRLLGLGQQGQNAALGLSQLGQQGTQNLAGIMQSGAAAQGNLLSNAAYQGASGLNALGSSIGGALSNYGSLGSYTGNWNPFTQQQSLANVMKYGSGGGASSYSQGVPAGIPNTYSGLANGPAAPWNAPPPNIASSYFG